MYHWKKSNSIGGKVKNWENCNLWNEITYFVDLLKEKMPKIFEYLGILIFFYSNDHEPIHVHAKKGEYESKAEFYLSNGLITEIRITNIKGVKPLRGSE